MNRVASQQVAVSSRTATRAESALATLGMTLCFGSAWPVTKLAVNLGTTPLLFGELRLVFSALSGFALLALLGRLRLPGRADVAPLLVIALFQFAGFFLFAHLAIGMVAAGRTAVLSNAATIFVVPLSFLLLREAIPPRRWIASLLGIAGVACMAGLGRARVGELAGLGLLLAAAFSWAIAIVLMRRLRPSLSMLQLMPFAFTIAALVLLPALPHTLALPRAAWPEIAAIGFVAGPLGTWCVLEMAATLNSVLASLLYLLAPVTGLLLSVFWLGETADAGLILGTFLILGGVALAAIPVKR